MSSAFAEPELWSRRENIITDTGNLISHTTSILGASNIIVFGKSTIGPDCILRGDLKRLVQPTISASAAGGGGSATGGGGAAISIGRYTAIGEGSVIRPPGKCYKGSFSFYPVRIGDQTTIGRNVISQAVSIGTGVTVGSDCILGPFVVIKDLAVVEDGTVLPAGTTVPSLTRWAGFPGRMVGTLPESYHETVELTTKLRYKMIRTK